MIAQRLKLETFVPDPSARAPDSTPTLAPTDIEEARLAAFENGYRDGWDDAVAAQADASAAQRAEVARNLQALAFTQAEARATVLRDLAPLVRALVARVLPMTAARSLPQMIAEALIPFAELAAEAPVDLRVHPDLRVALEEMLPDCVVGLTLHIVEDATLTRGQALLRMGEAETRIDLDATVAKLAVLVETFFSQTEKDRNHG